MPYELTPTFSPDGRWIAYTVNEAGRFHVSVRPFPSGRGRWLVSSDGGVAPVWSRSRAELLYFAQNQQQIMVVPYTVSGEAFRAEPPRVWSNVRIEGTAAGLEPKFDLHPDGQRVAVDLRTSDHGSDRLVFVFNFFDELRRQAPAR